MEGTSDTWIWTAELDGVYTVHSAYKLIQKPSLVAAEPIFSLVWGTRVPSNIAVFIWKMVLNRLPSRVNLRKRKVITTVNNSCCPICLQEEESLNHLLITCPVAAEVWVRCYRWLGWVTVLPPECNSHLLQHYCTALNLKQNFLLKVVWFAIAWTLWMHRNQVIFNGGNVKEGQELLEGAQIRAWHWLTGKAKGFHFSLYE